MLRNCSLKVKVLQSEEAFISNSSSTIKVVCSSYVQTGSRVKKVKPETKCSLEINGLQSVRVSISVT